MNTGRKPFLGSDLEGFRVRLGLTIDDMAFLIGVTKSRWFYLTKKNANNPVADPTIAIYCRLLGSDNTLNIIPEFVPPQQVFSGINKESSIKLSQKEFSILMGNNESSASRWISGKANPSQSVKRLSHILALMITKYGYDEALDKIRTAVASEANLRGVPNIWSDGKWTDKNPIKSAN